MATVIRELFDKELGEDRVTLYRDGARGERYFLVDTRAGLDAVKAIGLPRIGDPYSSAAPNLKAVSIGPAQRQSGQAAPGASPPRLGQSVVPVQYETPGLSGSIPPSVLGQNWSEVQAGQGVVQVRFDVRAGTGNPFLDLPIAGGEGASKTVGSAQALVHSFYQDVNQAPWPLLLEYNARNPVNDGSIALPPLYGVGPTWQFSAAQVKFVSFAACLCGGDGSGGGGELVDVQMTLELSRDHLWRWQEEDKDGKARPGIVQSEIYEKASFGGLW